MVLLLSISCTDVPAEPMSRSSAQPSVSGAAEFRLAKENSRFQVGTSARELVEFGMHKWVGDNGVFATRTVTGMVLASPNGDSPSRFAGALIGGAAAHDLAVQDYFVAAGLPKEQISSVRSMTSGLLPTDSAKLGQVKPDLEALYSYIDRSVDGVPVVDSFAWARINEYEEVVTESVYWPPIPQSVVDNAKAFANSLANSTWAAAFYQRVPPHGRLVIRHTPGVWDGSFKAAVAYDVEWAGQTVHHDITGAKFQMPNEKDGAWARPPATRNDPGARDCGRVRYPRPRMWESIIGSEFG
ncbi:MAG: hypothetical protein R3B13_39000 [Polyangiaceae bacterium]